MKLKTFGLALVATAFMASAALAQSGTMQPIPNPPEKAKMKHHKAEGDARRRRRCKADYDGPLTDDQAGGAREEEVAPRPAGGANPALSADGRPQAASAPRRRPRRAAPARPKPASIKAQLAGSGTPGVEGSPLSMPSLSSIV